MIKSSYKNIDYLVAVVVVVDLHLTCHILRKYLI